MMKYYGSLLEMTLFSKQQVNQLVGNANTAKALLKSYIIRWLSGKCSTINVMIYVPQPNQIANV